MPNFHRSQSVAALRAMKMKEMLKKIKELTMSRTFQKLSEINILPVIYYIINQELSFVDFRDYGGNFANVQVIF